MYSKYNERETKPSCANSDGVQTKSESLHADQMVESVPQVKFEKEDGFLAIMDADPQVKFETKLFFHIHYKTGRPKLNREKFAQEK